MGRVKYRILEIEEFRGKIYFCVERCDGIFNCFFNKWVRYDQKLSTIDIAIEQVELFKGRRIKSKKTAKL